jgi:hypothetical protein
MMWSSILYIYIYKRSRILGSFECPDRYPKGSFLHVLFSRFRIGKKRIERRGSPTRRKRSKPSQQQQNRSTLDTSKILRVPLVFVCVSVCVLKSKKNTGLKKKKNTQRNQVWGDALFCWNGEYRTSSSLFGFEIPIPHPCYKTG